MFRRSACLVAVSVPLSQALHYEKPPCAADEELASLLKYTVCAPECKSGKCPSDAPSGVTAKPECALQDPLGNKYCVLECAADNECDVKGGAKCAIVQGTKGICHYGKKEAAEKKPLPLNFSVRPTVRLGAPSCKSDTGSNVDFAYAFKYPAGWDYAYMDSSHKLAKSAHTMNSDSSSISQTMMQIHNTDYSYVLWNDQPAPSGSSSGPNAHAKGALIFTGSGGVWLTHSLPHFPSAKARTAAGMFTDASDDFGQSFLCITLTAEELHKISPVMAINRPVVYDNQFTDEDVKTFSDVLDWAVNKKYDETTMTKEVTIKSQGGSTFQYFGKSGNWGTGKDLYRDLVAPSMGALDMEGWRRGAGVWDAACGKDQVLDILSVSYPEKDWITGDDHSKWAVTQSGTVFCVGDINRADGQDKRGGGTVCIHDTSFHSQMKGVIATTDKCHSGIVV